MARNWREQCRGCGAWERRAARHVHDSVLVRVGVLRARCRVCGWPAIVLAANWGPRAMAAVTSVAAGPALMQSNGLLLRPEWPALRFGWPASGVVVVAGNAAAAAGCSFCVRLRWGGCGRHYCG